jgi:hypothetical protein
LIREPAYSPKFWRRLLKDPTNPVLPTFFIVGAAKAGTTSLYHYLNQHPDVYMSPNKEPHWFSRVRPVPGQDSRPVASEEEYLELFNEWNGESAIGEASPSYLWDEEAPYRIKEAVPHAKIIAILRDPVERAYSHYLMQVREGKEDLPFMAALQQDYHEENKAWSASRLYVDLGFYADQVQRYLEVFGEEQVKICLYAKELIRNPRALLKSVMEFIEVDPRYAASVRTDTWSNTYAVPRSRLALDVFRSRIRRSRRFEALKEKLIPDQRLRARIRETLLYKAGTKPQMDVQARKFLIDLYREDVHRLASLIDRDLGHWLQTDGPKAYGGLRAMYGLPALALENSPSLLACF